MSRKTITLLLAALALLLFVSCINHYTTSMTHDYTSAEVSTDELTAREELISVGHTEEWLDTLEADGVCLDNMRNQMHFSGFADRVYHNQPIGPSGEVIMARYFGGLHFNDSGVLVVTVLDGAFAHAASATAIEEMREFGIIVETVEFSYEDIMANLEALNNVVEGARVAGATSWGIGALNRIELRLDPYSEEQKAIFNDFLYVHAINASMILISPAVTPEMQDWRAAYVATAAAFPRDRIAHVGEVEVSRTGIAFMLENRTDYEFTYGAPWDMAVFDYASGIWVPVTHLPGAGGGAWTMQAYMLQSGGIQRYRQNWEWRFGVLPPGRYLFIRDGWLGEWDRNRDNTYAVVEFVIPEDSPEYLPPAPDDVWPEIINLVEYHNITPYGMTVVIENISAYDLDHRAHIMFIVPKRYAVSDYWWDWQRYQLPRLPASGYWIDYLTQGEGFLPGGGQLEFALDWEAVFGQLPPDDYIIALDLGGRAHPPHPTGWAFGSTLMISFSI